MLIKLSDIQKKYNLNPQNVIHIGAHDGQEYNTYKAVGVKNITWIEANPEISTRLEKRFQGQNNINVINSLVSDKDNEEIFFNITNNEQSSSILDLGSHKNLFPDVFFTKKIRLFTKTIDTIISEFQIKDKFDFINIDVQGAELLVLKGAENTLKSARAIYTEVNTDYVYKNCALMYEIDEFLSTFGFSRVETKMWQNHPWGDALYLKN
tara:strand:- start:335 stop:961 length:627 start_codon:yes stop_codon:yes gene_type:complete